MLDKILKIGFYLFLFLLPWQTRFFLRAGEINQGYLEYATISIYVVDVLLLFLILLGGVKIFKELKKDTKITITWKVLAGLEFFIFISIFFAPDKLLALYRYILFLLGVGLFFILENKKILKLSRTKAVWSFLSGVFLSACLGIYQFLAQSSFACKYLGLASHDAQDLGTSVVETIAKDGIGERWLRAYGSFDHPNILGGVLAVSSILLILEGIKKKNTSSKHQIAFNLFLVVFLVALFFTFSRTAWLASLVGVVVLLLTSIYKKDLWAKRKILEVIFISAVVLFMLFMQYEDLVITRTRALTNLELKSKNERIDQIVEARGIIKDNFWFGTGVGNYTQVLAEKIPEQESWSYQAVHNVFLLVLAEIGVLGFLFFVGFLIFIFHKVWGEFGLAIIMGILVILMLDHWLWSFHFGVLFFWLSLGMMKTWKKY